MASNNILQSQRERCCQICRLRFDNELAALRHLSSNLHAAFTAELKADLSSAPPSVMHVLQQGASRIARCSVGLLLAQLTQDHKHAWHSRTTIPMPAL